MNTRSGVSIRTQQPVRLHVVDSPADGAGLDWHVPAIVLVHGWSCDSTDWDEFVPHLRQHARVVTLDLRGHGRSPVASSYDLASMANDVGVVLDDLGIDDSVLVGHSAGAEVVVQLALDRPELARLVVAVEPAYGVPEGDRESLESVSRHLHAVDPRTVVAERFASIPEPAHLQARHRRLAFAARADVSAAMFDAVNLSTDGWHFETETRRTLGSLRVPLLAIYRNDRRAAIGRTFVKGPEDAVLDYGAGHWPHQEHPRRFLDDLDTWIRSHSTNNAEWKEEQ